MMYPKSDRGKSSGNATPLYGLILAGGKSNRMKKDKALLVYREQPHLLDTYHLVASLCVKTWVSHRKKQSGTSIRNQLPQILDSQGDIGPLGGILSAFDIFPHVAWLVVSCDLPFLDRQALSHLIRSRNPGCQATSFTGIENRLPEPMCAIYEPASFHHLRQFAKQGNYSPREALMACSLRAVTPTCNRTLQNVNVPGEYSAAREKLRVNP